MKIENISEKELQSFYFQNDVLNGCHHGSVFIYRLLESLPRMLLYFYNLETLICMLIVCAHAMLPPRHNSDGPKDHERNLQTLYV